jgi:protein-disulfide isomerase
LIVYSLAAILLAAVVVVGALVLTSGSTPAKPMVAPFAPQASMLTPTSIHSDGLTLGDANAPHTLNLWEDFQCPHCADFTRDAEPQVVANFVVTGKLKLVYHDFLVIDTTGTESLDAANAARCASDQGMFWPYHDWLFTNQYSENSGAYTKDRLKTIGQMVGIKDLTTFNSCVDNGTHNTDVTNEQSQISSSWQGTPTLIIDNGTPLSSYDYDTVVAGINDALGISPSPSVGSSSSASTVPGASAAPSASAAPAASAS